MNVEVSRWLIAPAIGVVILAAIFVPLERVFRAREQPIFRAEWPTDGLFLLGQYWAFGIGSTWVFHRASQALPHLTIFAERSWWLQAVIAVVLGDLTVYAFHRACHRSDFLWRFHEVHHSSVKLDWLAAYREHPVDGFLTAFAMNLPAMLLGLSLETMAGLFVFRALSSIFVHANVTLSLGPLRWIFGDPRLHRFHHQGSSRTVHNYGNLAPYLDYLFGTHHDPGRDEGYLLGSGAPRRSYLGHLLAPFRSSKSVLGPHE